MKYEPYGETGGGEFASPLPEACLSNVSSGTTSPTHDHHLSQQGGGDVAIAMKVESQDPFTAPDEGRSPVWASTSAGASIPDSTDMKLAPKVPRVVSQLSTENPDGREPAQQAHRGSPSSSIKKKSGKSSSKNSGPSKSSPTRRRSTVKPRVPFTSTSSASKASGEKKSFDEDDDEDESVTSGSGANKSSPTTTVQRRQKRLERNRESARLSRRRRKQYLEVLEDRVTEYSHDLDKGRRAHVAAAIDTIRNKRKELLLSGSSVGDAFDGTASAKVQALHYGLSRTSQELMIAYTFRSQQIKSFALPPGMKFVLWMTLQDDQYFRGGRASSERLSAARIGERVRFYYSNLRFTSFIVV